MKPVVVITGALGGIGRSLCDVFAERGYQVIGVDKKEKVDDFIHDFVQSDISSLCTKPKALEEFRETVLSLASGNDLRVLVNNAAIQIVKNTDALNWQDWELTFATNVFAPFFLVRAFLPELRKSDGCVINMGSIHARLTKAEFTAYSTSKGALVSLTRAMAQDLAPEVRVNAIIPAATDTPMLRAGFEDNPQGFEELGRYHPLKRIAKPEEVAKVAVFLSSGESSFITGSTIWVDGGIGGVLNDPVFAR